MKKIFITGVSSGIGQELTKQLVSQGHEVWGVARQANKLSELKNKLSSNHFTYSVCDITDPESVAQVLVETKKLNFVPDVVVLNAGIFLNDLSPNYNYSLTKEIFNTNINGALIWVEAWLGDFKNRNSGQFIAVCSTAAFRGNLRGVAYPASKAALAIAFRSLRLKYSKKNISFSNIFFGPIDSHMWEGKKNFLLGTIEAAAKHVVKVIDRKLDTSYFPFLSTLLFKLTKFLPDKIYSQVTEKTLK